MTERKILTSPIDLVTEVLELKSGIVTKDSAMGETPHWDSLRHVEIIGMIEERYGVTIPDNEIENYVTMKAIIELYNKQSGNFNSGQRIKEFLKKVPILKIFVK